MTLLEKLSIAISWALFEMPHQNASLHTVLSSSQETQSDVAGLTSGTVLIEVLTVSEQERLLEQKDCDSLANRG